MKKVLAIAALAGLISLSCEDENLSDILNGNSGTVATAYMEVEGIFINAYTRIETAMRNPTLITTGMATIDGAMVTFAQDTLTIDFGEVNVLVSDGSQRRGKISAYAPIAFLAAPNAEMTVTTSDFYVDNRKVELFFEAKNLGSVGASQIFDVDTLDLIVANGDYMLRGTKRFAWATGFPTLNDQSDDTYRISGRSMFESPTDTLTISAQFSNSDPLLYSYSCQYEVESGTIDMDIIKEVTTQATIDLIAEDGCNNLMRFTNNGITLTLPFAGF